MSAEHPTIYLQPPCCVDPNEGRQWCQDDVWPCADCPEKVGGIRYDVAAMTDEATGALATALTPDAVERVAEAIYNHWRFGTWWSRDGEKPLWIPGGNSTAQVLARDFARAAIEALSAAPDRGLADSIMDIVAEVYQRGFKEGFADGKDPLEHLLGDSMHEGCAQVQANLRARILTALRRSPAPGKSERTLDPATIEAAAKVADNMGPFTHPQVIAAAIRALLKEQPRHD